MHLPDFADSNTNITYLQQSYNYNTPTHRWSAHFTRSVNNTELKVMGTGMTIEEADTDCYLKLQEVLGNARKHFSSPMLEHTPPSTVDDEIPF